MRRSVLLATLLATALGFGIGCKKAQLQSTPEPLAAPSAGETTPPLAGDRPTEVTEGFRSETPPPPAAVEPTIDELNSRGVLKSVYFQYDSSDLSPEARATLQTNAEWLKRNAAHPVEIGGHCDERGSIEYNLALGSRRASMVKDYLVDLGVSGSRLDPVSYGEEKPVDRGHGEEAWSQNRRADFRIKS